MRIHANLPLLHALLLGPYLQVGAENDTSLLSSNSRLVERIEQLKGQQEELRDEQRRIHDYLDAKHSRLQAEISEIVSLLENSKVAPRHNAGIWATDISVASGKDNGGKKSLHQLGHTSEKIHSSRSLANIGSFDTLSVGDKWKFFKLSHGALVLVEYGSNNEYGGQLGTPINIDSNAKTGLYIKGKNFGIGDANNSPMATLDVHDLNGDTQVRIASTQGRKASMIIDDSGKQWKLGVDSAGDFLLEKVGEPPRKILKEIDSIASDLLKKADDAKVTEILSAKADVQVLEDYQKVNDFWSVDHDSGSGDFFVEEKQSSGIKPFVIEPGASESVVISKTGVGVGVGVPKSTLHIKDKNGDGQLRIESSINHLLTGSPSILLKNSQHHWKLGIIDNWDFFLQKNDGEPRKIIREIDELQTSLSLLWSTLFDEGVISIPPPNPVP